MASGGGRQRSDERSVELERLAAGVLTTGIPGDVVAELRQYHDLGALLCREPMFLLPELAKRMDRATVLRTVTHDVIDEHAAAVNFMHTGRPVSGTTVYPSIGSVVSHELGAGREGVPAYVLAGYPSVSRGAGFLGAKHSYLYLLDTEKGPAGLSPAPDITEERQRRRDALLGKIRETVRETRDEDDPVVQYDTLIDESRALANGPFSEAFHLASEPDELPAPPQPVSTANASSAGKVKGVRM